ncbi:MAG: DUF2169 domain-containing protein [Myxococcales bacterium]|nr:DUF2169 domain-containing protein [Myxococcales bacterium]
MHVKNLTPFPHATRVTSLRPPALKMTVIVRGAWLLTPDALREPEGIPQLVQGMISGDRYAEDDDAQSGAIAWASDIVDLKPNTDILFLGSCHTPRGQPMTECPVELRLGTWHKALRVVGDRSFKGGMLGARPTEPAPFTSMPIDYAHAFGGPGFEQNPVGKGFDGGALPNVESPRAPIRSKSDRPPPASFAPVSARWPQRWALVGKNYGKDWSRARKPFYSDDFNWRHFNAAPVDQQLERYLRGDEPLQLQNLHPEHPVLRTRLPGLRVRVFIHGVGGFHELAMHLDTVVVAGDEGRVYLTWRGLGDVTDAEFDDVASMLIASERLDEAALSIEHYRDVLLAFEADPLELATRVDGEHAEFLELMRGDADLDTKTDAYIALIERKGGEQALRELEARDPKQRPARERLREALAAADREDNERPAPVPVIGRTRVFLRPQLEEAARRLATVRAQLPADPSARAAAETELAQAEAKLADEELIALDPTLRPPGARALSRDMPGPKAMLTYRDFTGADLSGCDLAGADLTGAVLLRANLRGANLRGANLTGAMLFRSDLTQTDLSSATLSRAHLGKARMHGAKLDEAQLDEAFFDEAVLVGASLVRARGDNVFFNKCALAGLRAAEVQLRKARFEDAELTEVDLTRATLEQCIFKDARGVRARFDHARINRCNFVDAQLSGASFAWAVGARTLWRGAALDDADFTAADLEGALFQKVTARGARFCEAILTEAHFTKAELADADFSGAKLVFAELMKATIDRVRFRDANLFRAALDEARGVGCDFKGANLKESSLER